LYVITYTFEQSSPVYRLHALGLRDLKDKVAPVVVEASHKLSDGSFFAFSAHTARQRAALVLNSGNVYAGFGSFCDIEANNSRGWVLGWNADSLTPLPANRLNDTQATSPNNYFLSSIWMSGAGIAVDGAGNLFFVTSNSDPVGTTYDGVTNIQQSAVKVSPDLTGMLGIFTPSDAQFGVKVLDVMHLDFGAGGILLFPDRSDSAVHLAVAAGKAGQMYLLDQDNLGGYNPSGSNNVLATTDIGPCWCSPSYYVGSDGVERVIASGGSQITSWMLQRSPSPTLIYEAQSNPLTTGQDNGFFTAVSSDGTTAGTAIIWAVSRPVDKSPAQVLLYAFDAVANGGVLPKLYSGVAGTWPNVGGNSNIVPVVANGYVYVASYKQLSIFGVKTSATASASPEMTNPLAATTGISAPFEAPDTPSRPENTGLVHGLQYALNTVASRDPQSQVISDVAGSLFGVTRNSRSVPGIKNAAVYVASTTPSSSPRNTCADALVPPGTSRLYGTVLGIEGDVITLRLRNAKTISVDLSEALHDSKSVVPVVGSAVVVTGKFSASGTLHALQMLRAKSSEQLWDIDIGPQ
jgi:hypothetical protein